MPSTRQNTVGWQKLLEDTDQPIWVVDAEWRIVAANKALRTWWGAGGDQLVGQEISFNSALAPDPAVFTGCAIQTFIDYPPDAPQRLSVQWWPLTHTGNETRFALAWGTRVDVHAQDSSPRITPATDWHALLLKHRSEAREQASLNRFVGSSLAMQTLRARAERAVRQADHVWIFGLAGSGRRTLARTIRAMNSTNAGLFAEWDAALLTPELLHRHVADFTALNQARRLKTPADAAAEVLLLNAEHLTAAHFAEIKPLLEKTPVRFFLTSNAPAERLPQLAEWPKFLLAAWSALTIEVPPLGSRQEDLPLLVQQIIEEQNRAGAKQLRGCSLAALELLAAYLWPGEVAELAAILRAAHTSADGMEIQPKDLPAWLRQAESALSSPRLAPRAIDLDQQLAEIERELLARALRLAGGNKTQAAKLVGWTRNRLLRRGEELGLLRRASEKSAANEPEFIPDLPFEPEE